MALSFYSSIPAYVGVTLLLFSQLVHASSKLTPTISVQESYLSNQFESGSETGQITTITPGFTYRYKESRSELDLDYAYIIDRYAGLGVSDKESNQLDLAYAFNHIPEKWLTQFTARAAQSANSGNGLQSLISSVDRSDTQELRIYALSTAINRRLKRTVNFSSRFEVNHADYEGRDNTESLGIEATLDNQLPGQPLFWSTDLSTTQSKTNGSSDGISSMAVAMNYRLDSHYTSYINYQYDTTRKDHISEHSTLLGFIWQTDARNSVNLGIGSRSGDPSYFLQTQLATQRLSMTAGYREEITTARQQTITQLAAVNGLITSSQSLSTTPILEKRFDINLTYTGRRTSLVMNVIAQQRSDAEQNIVSQKIRAIGFSFNRRLSTKSTLQVSVQNQHSTTTDVTKIKDLQVSYNRDASRRMSWTTEVSYSDQNSSQVGNAIKRTALGASLLLRF